MFLILALWQSPLLLYGEDNAHLGANHQWNVLANGITHHPLGRRTISRRRVHGPVAPMKFEPSSTRNIRQKADSALRAYGILLIPEGSHFPGEDGIQLLMMKWQ